MATTPFPALRRDYFGDKRFKTSGVRKGTLNKLVVHTAEGCLTARCVAEFFLKPEVKASTHGAIDASGRSGQLMLPEHAVPWGAPGVNHDGWHVELCGFADWTHAEWLAHDLMLRNAAYRFALRAVWNNIPVRWLTPQQLKSKPGIKGLCTHADASAAFTPGGHHDPGPNFPKDVFLAYVKDYVALIKGDA